MTIDYTKKLVPQDQEVNLLASSEKQVMMILFPLIAIFSLL